MPEMKIAAAAPCRELHAQTISCGLCIVGGGLAGTCAAITAARAGVKVTLVQDRPVLGGNASSEIRLWILGATSHMGNNNRWALEGGVIHEILTENLWRNPEGNPVLLDSLLLEKVQDEPNIRFLLNTAAFEMKKGADDTIAAIQAFCSQNSTRYTIRARLFADASGDGILGFLSGAAFRIGSESRHEFNESYAPETSNQELLGHSLYFMSKDLGRPVSYVPPRFASSIEEIRRIHRYRSFNARSQACQFWWMEYGGRLDTVHASEEIKGELWRVAYGVWNYIKNSGHYPEAETMTLEWVGHIPGKRESRRFEGDIILKQQDIVGQTDWPDVVSYGGWAIDHHPVDGFYSEAPGCTQWHAKGVYGIPYRALYSRNIPNLFLAGRIISASHIAFGSTRVMATCAHNAQAVGVAAAHCLEDNLLPSDLTEPKRMHRLQHALLKARQYIPGHHLEDEPHELAHQAVLSASSSYILKRFEPNGETQMLDFARAMMLPLGEGKVPAIRLRLDATQETTLYAQLRISSSPANHTPDSILSELAITISPGTNQEVLLEFDADIDTSRYAFICLLPNSNLSVHLSEQRTTGILSLAARFNRAVAVSNRQEPPAHSGIESFEFWLPERRPEGKNFALEISPPLACFNPENVLNGVARPVEQTNAWVAANDDLSPSLTLRWPEVKIITGVELTFDADFDHPMESVIMGHPERVAPFCVKHFRIRDARNHIIYNEPENHQPYASIQLDGVPTSLLKIEFVNTWGTPAALFDLRVYDNHQSNPRIL